MVPKAYHSNQRGSQERGRVREGGGTGTAQKTQIAETQKDKIGSSED